MNQLWCVLIIWMQHDNDISTNFKCFIIARFLISAVSFILFMLDDMTNANSTVLSLLQSSTKITSSTISNGISLYVFCKVNSALYAGKTITNFLSLIIYRKILHKNRKKTGVFWNYFKRFKNRFFICLSILNFKIFVLS